MTYAVMYKCKTERVNHHGGDIPDAMLPRLKKSGFSYRAFAYLAKSKPPVVYSGIVSVVH